MKVGRKIKEICDNNRLESLSEINGKRKFMISLFYPIDEGWQEKDTSKYLNIFSPQINEALKIFKQMGVNEEHLKNLRSNFYNDAPIEQNNQRYPVILYSPGIGVDRDMYLFNINKLVLEGNVVITVGATYDTLFTVFPNEGIVYQSKIVEEMAGTDFEFLKKLIDIRVEDMSFLLDSLSVWNETDEFFRNKFDLDSIGVIGHSLGGAAVYELAKKDARIKTGIILDGSLHLISHKKNMDKPFLSIRQEKSNYKQMKQICSDKIAESYSYGQKSLFNTLKGYKLFLKVKNSDHMSFTDVPIIYNDSDQLDDSVSKVHEVINKLTVTFFNDFLLKNNTRFSQLVNTRKNSRCISVLDQDGQEVLDNELINNSSRLD